MSCTNKLRRYILRLDMLHETSVLYFRRISKKWLTIVTLCGLVDGLAFLLYWRSYQPPSITIRQRLVHEVDVIYSGDTAKVIAQADEGHHKDNQELKEYASSHLDGLLPKDILEKAKGPTKKIEALKSSMKHNSREKAMLERMEKSMMKDAKKSEQDIARLPKPKAILAEAQGPVPQTIYSPKPASKRIKLIIIARENTGFPVLGQFFDKKSGFFEHGEPPHEVHMISNLLNCVLTPEIVETFPEQIQTDFGKSLYFKDECLLDSHTVCNDPLSYETACSKYPHQILHSKHFTLQMARKLLKTNEDMKIIFLVRDPRGILRKTSSKPQKICSKLTKDLEEALALMSEFPKQFSLARYEVLAISPMVEVSKLLENLEIDFPLSSEEISSDKDDWNVHKNSVQKVNSWKQKLSIKELQKIENQCLETLSKLEYQLLGQGVA